MEDSIGDGPDEGSLGEPYAGPPVAFTTDTYDARKRWGVRMEDGTVHGGLKYGDAENLEVITDGHLVELVNGQWEDTE